jgi:radical SAM superfamily enzyme YgiQ (UPF0313 family)
MKPTILFVEPTGATANIFAHFMSIPLLGPMYLATIARNAGLNASIFNENIMRRPIGDDELAEVDLLCLSCITTTIDRGKTIARRYRDVRASLHRPSKVIVGGIHASMIPDDVSSHFDQVVVGEAETVFLDIVNGAIKDPLVQGHRLDNLDSLPIPDFSLMRGWGRRSIKPVMTSRGCPFDCNFCSVTKMFGTEYRSQSPHRVLSEIMRLKGGIVFFVDDNFAVDIKRSNEILDLMIDRGFGMKWTAQVRTNVTHKPDFVRKMKRAGCKVVYVGFESINPQSLKDMNKCQTVDDIKRSIRVFHENGIMVHGMFILGNDADTADTFGTTAAFAKENDIDYVQYSVLTPLPGTEIFARFEQEGRLLHRDWGYYDGLHVTFSPKTMTANDLQRGMIQCFSDFYSYTNAFNDALNAAVHGAQAAFQNLYKNAHLPSFYPPFIKLVGKNILREWLKENRQYLHYLLSRSSAGVTG